MIPNVCLDLLAQVSFARFVWPDLFCSDVCFGKTLNIERLTSKQWEDRLSAEEA